MELTYFGRKKERKKETFRKEREIFNERSEPGVICNVL
jgi:hypothetical protein